MGGPGLVDIFQILHFSYLIFSVSQRFSNNIFGLMDYLGDNDQNMIYTSAEYLRRKEYHGSKSRFLKNTHFSRR